MTEVQISFITPLFNCLAYTKDYLETLEATIPECSYEIILVDDWSTDGTREFLATLPSPPFRILLNEENLGFATSSNAGAREANGEYLCFLNNDLVLRPGWLEPLLDLIVSNRDVGAVGNVQIESATGLVHHAGIFFDWEGRPLHAWRYRRRGPRGDFGEQNAVTAACVLMRSETFQEFGGFDEGYHNGFEDVDLCVRMRRKGYRLLVSYRKPIIHHGSTSPGRKRFDDKNCARFLERWQSVTRRWGRREWPEQFVQRGARRWWKMLSWKRIEAYGILLGRRLCEPEAPQNTR